MMCFFWYKESAKIITTSRTRGSLQTVCHFFLPFLQPENAHPPRRAPALSSKLERFTTPLPFGHDIANETG